MIYHIEAEIFKGAVISRVYFKGEPETNHSAEGEVFAQRLNNASCYHGRPDSCLANNLQSCVNRTVYIKVGLHFTLISSFIQAAPVKSKLLLVSQHIVAVCAHIKFRFEGNDVVPHKDVMF